MTWIEDPAFGADQPFGPQTLPYGVVEAPELDGPSVAVRVGDHALPLRPIAGSFSDRLAELVAAGSLDGVLAAGRPVWSELRARLTELVTAGSAPRGAKLVPLSEVTNRLPFTVADYVDFYSSRHHAENVGRMFRPDSAPLLPNWTHLPVGYHGRAGTVVVSGTDVVRPHGQRKGPNDPAPAFGPSTRLDIEAEVGFVCGGPVTSRVSVNKAAEHIFGVALVNDWSARDLQAWEYVPLGPFLAKSFLTSVGAWITPLDALSQARVAPAPMGNELHDYLVEEQPLGLDIRLEVRWNGTLVSRPPFASMAWTCAQQLAHMTVNGATLRPGDLFASGTVSGPEKQERGSFLELSWAGKEPVVLDDGAERTFLEDGDTVVITATAPGPDGSVIGFAEVSGTVLAAPVD
ncbi:fumarylacetoacetase [Allokutzneria sp. A3M-2-11 16]|uniref:fumarylacetoacetase n=1 Tax=Allokutzneria sp. A3M-2-11 16 TaxID=2962043 RepID=UPI0020B848DC|nr:fumarylacetoacetase [Allokutzneria sp. A3M-2-11 16]MCP3799629.1 fumarylacetoacetase [Allokutzneria sp. A3M-2-11 16]